MSKSNKHLVVLTGAGISRESGLLTFRDSDGLWEGYDVHEVASIEGWHKNPELVLEFYNMRRSQAWKALPNEGHNALVDLEKKVKVSIITQNVDTLHEKAGSSDVLHLHGNLFEAKGETSNSEIIPIHDQPILLGDRAPDGTQLRPNIVWFGEEVPAMESAAKRVETADALLIVGTSLMVYPAASLVHFCPPKIPIWIVDPGEPFLPQLQRPIHILRDRASSGVPKACREIITYFSQH